MRLVVERLANDAVRHTPAHYHINGGNLSFVDGHAENKSWTDSGILSDENRGQVGFTADGDDLHWLQVRATVSKVATR